MVRYQRRGAAAPRPGSVGRRRFAVHYVGGPSRRAKHAGQPDWRGSQCAQLVSDDLFRTKLRNDVLEWDGDHRADGTLITAKHKGDEGGEMKGPRSHSCPFPESHFG